MPLDWGFGLVSEMLRPSPGWEGGDLLPPFRHDPLDEKVNQDDHEKRTSNSNFKPLSFQIFNDRSNLVYEKNCFNSKRKGYVNLFAKSKCSDTQRFILS